MKKQVYKTPTVELIDLQLEGCILTASGENTMSIHDDVTHGGSEALSTGPEFPWMDKE
jgi:hypothetical protein